MAAAKRVVRHALFSYVDPAGVQRMAVRGDTVELDGDELKRAERFEAVAADEAALAKELADLAEPEPEVVEGPESSPAGAQGDDDLDDDDLDDDDLDGDDLDGDDLDGPTAPAQAATKALWVDYRFAQQDGRLSREQLDGLTKEQLKDDAFVAGLQPQQPQG